MVPKSATRAELRAMYDKAVLENRKLEEELQSLRPLLRVVEAQKETIRCQQEVITSLQTAGASSGTGGQLAEDLPWGDDPPMAASPSGLTGTSSDAPMPGLYAVYTDGACIGNGCGSAPGGWAAIVVDPDKREKEFSGGINGTTNNRMELMAAIRGLSKVPRGAKVKLVSDSQYLINGLQKNWAKGWRANGWYKKDGGKALNPDLWQQLLELTEQRQMFYEWVRGHAGHSYNERCDRLATAEAERVRRETR